MARMQAALQLLLPKIGSVEPNSSCPSAAHTCSCRCRPVPCVRCERMFPKTNPSTLTQRALTGLRLCRSFLMLEDDDAVDWEVGWTERAELAEHPHRAALRERRPSRRMPRRPGQPSPAVHACASPTRR